MHYELCINIILFISWTGSGALRTVPERAMPLTPVCIMDGMSSMVMPPDGNNRDVNALRLHLCHDVLIAFETEDRGETLLCGGETEWTTTDVIGRGTIVGEDIIECVCRATDDEVVAEKASGFGYRHIVLTEMNTIGATLTDEFDMIVDDECCLILVA